MVKKNVNYNGEALQADEVLVFTPYFEEDASVNVTNKESIVTVKQAGRYTKAVLKAVPKKYEKLAKAQFNSWQREQKPEQTEGRCMILQPDGTYKQCPKKGNNCVSCNECPLKGKLKRKVTEKVSMEEQEDEHEYALTQFPAADEILIARENLAESQKRIADKFEAIMEKSPKYCFAMLLMGMGVKGEKFAEQMHLGHDAAKRIRNQIISTAPDGITNFDQIDIQTFQAYSCGETEYYKKAAEKALEMLMQMYF